MRMCAIVYPRVSALTSQRLINILVYKTVLLVLLRKKVVLNILIVRVKRLLVQLIKGTN